MKASGSYSPARMRNPDTYELRDKVHAVAFDFISDSSVFSVCGMERLLGEGWVKADSDTELTCGTCIQKLNKRKG